MRLVSADETVTIPFSADGTASYFDLSVNGERFAADAIGKITKNEDDVPVFRLAIHFLETTSVRYIKIFFHRTKTLIRFSEEPSGANLLEEFSPVLSEFLPDNKPVKSLLAKTDNNNFYELVDKFFTIQYTAQ